VSVQSTTIERWTLLVPVKRLDIAKTRLALDSVQRSELALAMALDTVSAALDAELVAEVVVITDDARATRALSEVGARVVTDVPDAGLNPALVHGSQLATHVRVAALSSDLPGLQPRELDDVLRAASHHAVSVVGDTAGIGTTLLAAARAADFAPAFGVDSRAAHVKAGAVDLTDSAGESVRHDVDTIDALREAVRRGVGSRTHAAISALDLGLERA
jgi:2-phospho-L-lactate/phosphoenolpyruvate guanylyltransferase